jgi:sugar O-acyltransferase (sialic acid O-acetyltransferase NeuD family)
MKKPLIIIGDSAFAQIAYEYFTHDSEYQVVAFAVEQAYLKKDCLFGLPVIAFESLEEHYLPQEHYFFAALVYTQLNGLRQRLYETAKQKGYQPASYISSRAFLWHNVKVGEHCFIFEGNVIQAFCTVGDNVILWSGNHIGHHSQIQSHCFIASHVVISGFCSIGERTFIGVNATLSNNLTVGSDSIIGAGTLVQESLNCQAIVKAKSDEVKTGALRLARYL